MLEYKDRQGGDNMMLKAFQIGIVMFCGGFLGTIGFALTHKSTLIQLTLLGNVVTITTVIVIEMACK